MARYEGRDSSLIPQEGGYPIVLGQGITEEDLEVDYIPARKGARMVLLPEINPYMMKGATSAIRALNAKSGAELDDMAEQLAEGSK